MQKCRPVKLYTYMFCSQPKVSICVIHCKLHFTHDCNVAQETSVQLCWVGQMSQTADRSYLLAVRSYLLAVSFLPTCQSFVAGLCPSGSSRTFLDGRSKVMASLRMAFSFRTGASRVTSRRL